MKNPLVFQPFYESGLTDVLLFKVPLIENLFGYCEMSIKHNDGDAE